MARYDRWAKFRAQFFIPAHLERNLSMGAAIFSWFKRSSYQFVYSLLQRNVSEIIVYSNSCSLQKYHHAGWSTKVFFLYVRYRIIVNIVEETDQWAFFLSTIERRMEYV